MTSTQTVWKKDGFAISTDRRYLDLDMVLGFLHGQSYWGKDIPLETLRRSIANSTLCFSLYHGDPEQGGAVQIGFARLLTDYARLAHLADVFIVPEYRGKGLSKWLLQVITGHPDLEGVRRFTLNTNDAHTLYAKFGFRLLSKPENAMERTLY